MYIYSRQLLSFKHLHFNNIPQKICVSCFLWWSWSPAPQFLLSAFDSPSHFVFRTSHRTSSPLSRIIWTLRFFFFICEVPQYCRSVAADYFNASLSSQPELWGSYVMQKIRPNSASNLITKTVHWRYSHPVCACPLL